MMHDMVQWDLSKGTCCNLKVKVLHVSTMTHVMTNFHGNKGNTKMKSNNPNHEI